MNLSPTYVFRIHGNHGNREGNPIGYTRVLKQHMRADAARYLKWQQYVRSRFADATNGFVRTDGKNFLAPLILRNERRARMDIIISWRDETHADSDNVWKGIADALFQQDKHLSGSFDFIHSTSKEGWVDVNIWIETPGPSP